MNSPLRSFLSSIILTIVILFEVLGLLADRHVPFGICQTISSTILSANSFASVIKDGCWALRDTSIPMDFITVQLVTGE